MNTRRNTRAWPADEAAIMRLILWLAIAAVSIGLWACLEQYRVVTLNMGAEDDCPFYHGVYELDEVKPDGNGHVYCIYRGLF